MRVPGEGPIPCDIMFIGERPGKDEDRVGKPFVGLAGTELTRYLAAGGLKRQEIYITNLVKTYSGGAKPERWEVIRDKPELEAEIRRVHPRVIALGGAYAIHEFMGPDWNVEDVHGIPMVGGTIPGVLDWDTTWVPTYHPAAGFYDAETQPFILDDFHRLGMVCYGDLHPKHDEYPGPDYSDITKPKGPDYNPSFTGAYLSIDTEGTRRHPWCLTYSHKPGWARMLKADAEEKLYYFTDYIRRFAALHPEWRVGLHNSLHDLEVLRRLGVIIPRGKFIDTMVWAYLLQVEPQGLKQLARRHCGMDMQSYDDVTGDAQRQVALDYLVGAAAHEWDGVNPYVIIEGGIAKIKQPHSINRRITRILGDISKGNNVDIRKRWLAIDGFVREPVETALGEMPEATLSDVPKAVSEKYANRDADATLRLIPILKAKITEMGLEEVSDIDHSILPMVDRMQHVGMLAAEDGYWAELQLKCEGLMNKAKYEIFKYTGAQINPNSGDQVADLLYGQLGLDTDRWTKTKKRRSTDDKSLEPLHDTHPVVPLVLDYREAAKVRDSFCRVIRRHAGGRIHPNFRVTRVVTGRLSATDPNLLAIPVRSDLGKEIRKGFVAPHGRVLGDWDLDQIEMRWMADESQDPGLLATFRAGYEEVNGRWELVSPEAKRDVHRETAAKMFGKRPEDVHPVFERYPAKRVGFGVITHITGHGLKDQMALARARKPDGTPWSEDDCDRLIEEWFKIYPGAGVYMDNCAAEARRYDMVRDRWGRIRYLPGAHSPIKQIREEACRQASSHKISAGAQGWMKQGMAKIWDWIVDGVWTHEPSQEELMPVEPLLQVHDEILLEFDEDPQLMEMADLVIVECLTRIAHISVPVLAKGGFGHNWAELKD